MAASLLFHAACKFALRVAFELALQQHAPAFLLHGPIAAATLNRVFDRAVGILIDRAVGVLIDTAISVLIDAAVHIDTAVGVLTDTNVGVLTDAPISVLIDTAAGALHIALWVSFVVMAVLLLASCRCVVAALAASVVYLDRARASRTRERRLVVLTFVSLFLHTVAVVLLVVLLLAIVDRE